MKKTVFCKTLVSFMAIILAITASFSTPFNASAQTVNLGSYSIIKGMQPLSVFVPASAENPGVIGGTVSDVHINPENFGKLTDGDSSGAWNTNCGLSFGWRYVVVFDMGQSYDLTSMKFYSTGEENRQISGIDFYANDSYNSLLTSIGKVASYSGVTERSIDVPNINTSGRYVAFVVTDPSALSHAENDLMARIAEFEVFGTPNQNNAQNLITGKKPISVFVPNLADLPNDPNKIKNVTENNVPCMVDGTAELMTNGDTLGVMGTNACFGWGSSFAYIYELNSVSNIDYVNYISTSEKNRYTTDVDFYVSNYFEDIFNTANRVAEYSGLTSRAVGYKSSGDYTGKYVGIVVKNGSNVENDPVVRISEIEIIGTGTDIVTTNLLSGKQPTQVYIPKSLSELDVIGAGLGQGNTVAELAMLTDENTTADNKCGLGWGRSFVIIYDFGMNCNVDLTAFCSTAETGYYIKGADYYLSEFTFDLFNANNCISKNEGITARAFNNTLTGASGRYLAVVVTDPGADNNNVVARISEISAYGYEHKIQSGNLVISAAPIEVYQSSAGTPDVSNGPLNQGGDTIAFLNDGIKSGENETCSGFGWGGNEYVTIYELPSNADITKIALYGRNGETKYYVNGMDCYVSASRQSLFNAENKVSSFKDGTNRILVTDTLTTVGKYVAVVVTQPCTQDGIARISEIEIYGALRPIIEITSDTLDFSDDGFVKLNSGANHVSDILSAVTSSTEGTIVIKNSQMVSMGADQDVCTGNTLELIQNGTVLVSYVIIIYGDINSDGKIDIKDLVRIKRYGAGLVPFSEAAIKACFYGNKTTGTVEAYDIVCLKKKLLDVTFS